MPQKSTSLPPGAYGWQPPFLYRAARVQRRLVPRWLRAALILLGMVLGLMNAVDATPADAAERGAGFGTWAPISAYGWHGSMLVDGVHTYCITPGAPAPTGATADHGVSGSAAGLSPQQLTAINLLVSTYGQTDDPVQAASVGWAVKAIANWEETLHAFGYRGASLAGAIDWTFSALAPEHSAAVQQRAVAFYEEATALAAGVAGASGSLVFETDAADHRAGSVRVDASVAATGSLSLTGAVFADSGAATRDDATTGTTYAIRTLPPEDGAAYSVSGTGRMSGGFAAAVRHYTTAGGQDTAGPAGRTEFEVAGQDAAPRIPPFTPSITTQVAARYLAGGPYVDAVSFELSGTAWPRDDEGAHLPLVATATVYRTDVEPVAGEPLPEGATPVGELAVTTAVTDPTSPYSVSSEWTMDAPGFYTAVWRIRAADQSDDLRARLGAGFEWVERFGEPSQVAVVPSITTRATGQARPGDEIGDTIVVAAPVPASGLRLRSSLYRAAEGVAAGETCVSEHLVWTSEWVTASGPGEYVVMAPPVSEEGTYYWQEEAVDADGAPVHRGDCGVENETTRVVEEEAAAPAAGPALAATGANDTLLRGIAGAAVALLTLGGTLLATTRRRLGARGAIG